MLRVASSPTKTAVLLCLFGLQAKANNGDGYRGKSSGNLGKGPANCHHR
jgi:hypothetical protein